MDPPAFTIYAVGDAGEVNQQSISVLKNLSSLIHADHHAGMVIFLGDNIYPAGLPSEKDATAYEAGREILMNQAESAIGYDGQVVFIPGNHDWNEWKPGGRDAIKREGRAIDSIDTDHFQFYPKNGCGGPVEMHLNDDLVMIIIDSQWWIADWKKEPDMNEGCDVQTRDEFIASFHQMVERNKDKQIIVAMHHPIYTQGSHGGHFSLKAHLFPLTSIVDWLYLPLPVIGSIFPYYRSIIGHPQDLSNPRYKSLRKALLEGVDYSGEMIFLSGHEHCLQYISKDHFHQIISGSGSKQTPVADDHDLVFGHKSGGLVRIDFYRDKEVRLSIYEADLKAGTFPMVYSRTIIGKLLN
jgi:hypothetical protein